MKLRLSLFHVTLFTLAAIPMLLTTEACAKPPAEKPPPCGTPDLGAIEASYVAEAVEACKGRTVRTCPELAPIEAKFAAKREAWIRCRP